MSNTIQLKRRTSGPAAAPAVLATGEPAYNEVNNVLYIGRSDGSIVTVGGKGAFLELNTNQTAAADYTFSGTVDFTGTIELDGTEITATAAELNTLAGITADVNELNALDGITADVNELNLLDGAVGNAVVADKVVVYGNTGGIVSNFLTVGGGFIGSVYISDAELLAKPAGEQQPSFSLTVASGNVYIGGALNLGGDLITATGVEINLLEGATANTVVNGKAVVYGYSGEISASSLTVSGTIYVNSDKEVATKEYVDATKQGLDVKDSVRVATTANITLSGLQTIDGVLVASGDRVLVKNQTTASQNGIYVAAAGAWSRATDADASADVTAGMYAFVSEGTTQADSGWVLTTNDAITLGTTALNFTQFSGAGQITAGDGLTKNGNTLNVAGTSGRIVANADSIDLATVGVAPGTYGSVTVDAYGRVTAGSADVDGGTYA